MLISMTGFGRSSITTKKGNYVVEVQSVNRRYLESSIYLPKDFLSLEIEIRRLISSKISRGQVSLRLTFYPSEENIDTLLPDVKLLKKLKNSWVGIAKDLKIDEKEIGINFLSSQIKSLSKADQFKDLTSESKSIYNCVNNALDEMILMKEKEGSQLVKDINKRLKLIESLLGKIEDKSKLAVSDYENKLKEKLSEFLDHKTDVDDRLLKEIVLYSDKVDITEEIIRLKSHIKQFYSFFAKKEALGRKMDFLIQEMAREVNTISSKASSSKISTFVVDIKSELEKIREQVQNIE